MRKLTICLLIFSLISGMFYGCSSQDINYDEAIINLSNAGYLYTTQLKATSSDEKEYNKIREKAISTFIETLTKSASYAFTLTDKLEGYEDNLLLYIEKIESVDSQTVEWIQLLTDNMLVYKTLINSKETEIKSYQKMKASRKVTQAIINTYLVSACDQLITLEQSYVDWLLTNTASVSIVLAPLNERQSDKTISSSTSIYEKKVEDYYNKMVFEYEKAITMNNYILSSDYYANDFFLEEILTNLNKIKSGDVDKKITSSMLSTMQSEVTKLEALYQDAITFNIAPTNLLPIPSNESSFSLIRKVNAAENNMTSAEKPIASLEGVNITEDIKYDNESNPTAPQAKSTFADIFSSLPSLDNIIKATKAFVKDPTILGDEDKSMAGVLQEYQIDIAAIEGGFNQQYIYIIKILSDKLAHKATLTVQEKTEANQLLTTELEQLLGNNKEQFISIIINSEAIKLVQKFNEWNEKNKGNQLYTKENLINLLNSFGVTLSEEVSIPPSPTVSNLPNTPASNTSPEVSQNPIPSPTQEDILYEPGDATHLIVTYEALISLNLSLDNEQLMFHLYGWEDPIDYTQYEKTNKTNGAGQIYETHYKDSSSNYVGWKTNIYTGYIEYTYYFPGDKTRSINIRRDGTTENSFFTKINSVDETIDRISYLNYKLDDQDSYYPQTISEKQNNVYDGLYKSSYEENGTYMLYIEGKIYDAYTIEDNMITKESHYAYVGDIASEDTLLYHDNGKLHTSYTKLDNKYEGTYARYDSDGAPTIIINYTNGIKDGNMLVYYDNKKLKSDETYGNGLLEGYATYYYDNGQIMREGNYVNDLLDGVWLSSTKEGILALKDAYKDGIAHGEHHQYATATRENPTTGYQTIYVDGQYDNGKMTGIWYYGFFDEKWAERHKYEDDVRLWTEYSSSDSRKYYDAQGTVIRTEPANKDEN